MKIERYAQGTPSWTDYGAPDQHAAKVFYAEIFGWTIYEDNFMKMGTDAPGMFYSMAKKDGSYTAAIHTQNEEEKSMGVPPNWKTYLTVEDVDAVTAKAVDLGGQVFAGPFNVFEAGRMSVIADSTGAVVHLWQPIQHIGSGIKNEHGALAWNLLITREQDRATEFYTELLGVGVNSDIPSPTGRNYNMFTVDGQIVAGCMDMHQQLIELDVPNHWEVYFQSDDIDATAELAASLGAKVMMPPTDMPTFERMAYLFDPQGAAFGVVANAP